MAQNPRERLATKVEGLVGVMAVASATAGLFGRASKVQATQFEYQPALQGLDYGKPRTVYPDFTQKDGIQYVVDPRIDIFACISTLSNI